MKWIRYTGVLVATLVSGALISGCDRSEPKPDLIILHTGRMAGNVYPTDFRGAAPLQHYPYLSSYVKRVRQAASNDGIPVLLMDLGDSLGGSFASHVTGGANMVAFFNHLGYDAVALGNLDNDVSPDILARLNALVLCPFIDGEGNSPMPGAAAAGVVDGGGRPVQIFSNFHGDLALEENPLRFPAWFGVAREGVEPVRDYEEMALALPNGPGVLRVFSWMKFESADDLAGEFLEGLRQLGVDVVLAHRVYSGSIRDAWTGKNFHATQPPVSENILRRNEGFTVARLDLRLNGDRWEVLAHDLLTMTSNTAPADTVIEQEISKFTPALQAADQPIAELEEPWEAHRIFDLYCVALAGVPGTEAVLYSRQSIRGEWPAGVLSDSRVFNALPWTTGLVQVTLTRGEMDALAGLRGVRFSRMAGADGPARVTTSRFFGAVLQRELGIAPDRLEPVGTTSEFDFFVDFLRSAGALEFRALDGGWMHEVDG